MKLVDWRVATLFVQERHYSPVMPKLTKKWLGAYQDDKLVGVLTLGWGTNPMGTIKKMFPELTTADYYEIGKMCMDDEMPRNSESQMISATMKWMHPLHSCTNHLGFRVTRHFIVHTHFTDLIVISSSQLWKHLLDCSHRVCTPT